MKTKLTRILLGIAALVSTPVWPRPPNAATQRMSATARAEVQRFCDKLRCRRAALPRGTVCAHRCRPLSPSDRHRTGRRAISAVRHQVRYSG